MSANSQAGSADFEGRGAMHSVCMGSSEGFRSHMMHHVRSFRCADHTEVSLKGKRVRDATMF